MKKYYPLHILCANGWTWHHYANDPIIQMDNSEDYCVYTLKILVEYHVTVRAVVASHSQHLCINGHYGVLWLDVAEYENDPPYGMDDLEDMLEAIRLAEDNLLKIGMPFAPDYQFNGNAANKRRRNEKLRRIYNLEELEKERD